MLHALAAEHSEREIWWLHGARNGRDHPFAEEARTLLASLANGRGHIAFSRPGPDDVRAETSTPPAASRPALLASLELPRDADAYVCGPAAFMSETAAALAELGLDPGRIHIELFGPAPARRPASPQRRRGRRTCPRGRPGRVRRSSSPAATSPLPWSRNYASLLELAEACDVPVRWSCRTGVCHSCETASSPARSSTAPIPSRRPPTALRSSAARSQATI